MRLTGCMEVGTDLLLLGASLGRVGIVDNGAGSPTVGGADEHSRTTTSDIIPWRDMAQPSTPGASVPRSSEKYLTVRPDGGARGAVGARPKRGVRTAWPRQTVQICEVQGETGEDR